MTLGRQFRTLRERCRLNRTPVIPVLLRHGYFRLNRKNIISSDHVTIYGLENITTKGCLEVGMLFVGFVDRHDRTLLNVRGKLEIRDRFSLGKGCRIDIGPGASASFGKGYVTANSVFSIMHGLTVGDDCAIAWGCQFLDDDFHEIHYQGKRREQDPRIVIGSHVWIGSNVSVLKGSVIPDGCVVASGSLVRSKFTEKNALIGGNPAKIIRENVTWRDPPTVEAGMKKIPVGPADGDPPPSG